MPAWKRVARFVFDHGGLPLVRARNRHALRILMYHHFGGMEEAFAAQCDHLRTHYHPLPLTEACRLLRNGDPLPLNALVLTVDDGFADFHSSAFPILAARQIPATVYLVTGFLDRRLWLWTDQVAYALRQTALSEAEIPLPDRPPLRLALATPSQREKSIAALKYAWKQQPDSCRQALLAELPRLLAVTIPPAPPAGYEPLSWDQVRHMSRHGIDFGGHTQTHPILSRLESAPRLEEEIAGCRARIEEEIQQPVRHFCYPNGRPEDVTPEVAAAVRRAGFESATTTISGLNRAAADPYMLRRIGVNPDVPLRWFIQATAGFRITEPDAR